MADYDPKHPPFVVAVFDTSNGKVSVNGEPWTEFQLKSRPDRPGGGGKRVTGSEAPPPGDGDDQLECYFCNVHHSCRVHLWTGSTWKCLGSGCSGPFCS